MPRRKRKGLGQGKGKGFKNIIPNQDKKTHSDSAKGIKQPQAQDMIPTRMRGGLRARDGTEREIIDALGADTLRELRQFLGSGVRIENFNEDESGVYRIETDDGREYYVFEDDDKAEAFAKERLIDDIENSPEMFGNLIGDFIDQSRLKDMLESDVDNMNADYYEDIADEGDTTYANRQIAELVQAGYLDEDDVMDKNGEPKDPDDISGLGLAIEQAVDDKTADDLRDPMEYLEGIYGRDEAVEQAVRIAGVDEDELAQHIIDNDGWQPTVASYDGNSEELANGTVLARIG